MTLIVGLACTDGVVLAADGLSAGVAFELDQIFKMAYPSSKINPMGNNILWGAAGSVGIIQAVEIEFEKLPKKVKNMSLHDLDLQRQIKKILSACVSSEIVRQRQAGLPSTSVTGAQLLLVANDPIRIWTVGYNDDAFVEQLGCGVIGNGTLFAHMALLPFRSNSFFNKPKSKSLSTEQGCLVAYRAIRDAIEASLDRVGLPVDIWMIKDNEKPTHVSGQVMKTLEEAYVMWKEAESLSYRNFFSTGLV